MVNWHPLNGTKTGAQTGRSRHSKILSRFFLLVHPPQTRWRNHLWRGRWSEVWKAAPFSPNKTWFSAVEFGGDTVDGSEIRQALVEVGFYPMIYRFLLHSRWLFGSWTINSRMWNSYQGSPKMVTSLLVHSSVPSSHATTNTLDLPPPRNSHHQDYNIYIYFLSRILINLRLPLESWLGGRSNQ